MSLDRCVFHLIDDTCNTFLVCFRAKSESIHCRSICDSLPSNHRHPGYSMSQSHCNMPNGEVSSKSTKDLIAFSRRVSGHFHPFNSLSPSHLNIELTLNGAVYFADIHVIPIATRQFIYEIGQLRLRGDVIIRCYQITTNERILNTPHQQASKTMNRELIFSTQFHTCAITDRDITFFRSDLDYACEGKS